ncbi:MAG: M56 family metallopeptidase [Planctomycetia bacterium]|nr:M56 family metallopeptidase [Planctomycetia bacterium]
MPADLATTAAIILSWGVTYLLHSTILVGGVWASLRWRTPAGHALRAALWKTALVGGVATATAQMLLLPAGPLGVLTWTLPSVAAQSEPDTGSDPATAQAALHSPVASTGSSAMAPEVWIIMGPEPGTELQPTASPPSLANETSRPAEGAVAGRTQVGAWLAQHAASGLLLSAFLAAVVAVAIGVARSVWQTLVLSRKLAGYQPLERGPARELLDELCRYVPRAPRVTLLAAPDEAEPAALGVREWTIVLPRRAIRGLSRDELQSLLAHELAHLVQGDSLWLWISRVVCSCLAFQPLNHLARREWQRAAEFLCDTWAVRHTGAPLALARCLTEVAGWRLGTQPSAALLGATGRKSGLVDRIERLLDARPQVERADEHGARQTACLWGGLALVLLAWCAPRVNLVAAEATRVRQTGESATAIDDAIVEEGIVEAEDVLSKAADDAKLEVEGVQEPARDVAENNAVRAEDRAVDGGRVRIAPQSVRQMLAALDRDLAALEAELLELQPLLHKAGAAPQAARLAARLNSEVAKLKQRRELLKGGAKLPAAKSFVNGNPDL